MLTDDEVIILKHIYCGFNGSSCIGRDCDKCVVNVDPEISDELHDKLNEVFEGILKRLTK